MDRNTGRRIDGTGHLRQSIADIITTPLGTRLERRTYGSLVPAVIDQPANAATRLRCYAAIASALMNWERRLRLTRVALEPGERPGQAIVSVQGEHRSTGAKLDLSMALHVLGAA